MKETTSSSATIALVVLSACDAAMVLEQLSTGFRTSEKWDGRTFAKRDGGRRRARGERVTFLGAAAYKPEVLDVCTTSLSSDPISKGVRTSRMIMSV